jgi:hypothetical protein
MTLRSAVAASFLAMSALALAPEAAEAKTKVFIGIGGYPCYSHSYLGCGYGYPYYARRHYYYSGYPYYDDYDDDYYVKPVKRRISCSHAAEILRDHGYRKIKARDCGGRTYTFRAHKKGHIYLVSVSSRTGRIVGRDGY